VNVNGQEDELAAWIKTGKSGQKFMSLKVQEPRDKAPKPVKDFADIQDDDPFRGEP